MEVGREDRRAPILLVIGELMSNAGLTGMFIFEIGLSELALLFGLTGLFISSLTVAPTGELMFGVIGELIFREIGGEIGELMFGVCELFVFEGVLIKSTIELNFGAVDAVVVVICVSVVDVLVC